MNILKLVGAAVISIGTTLFIYFQATTLGVASFGFAPFVNLLFMAMYAVLVSMCKPALAFTYFETHPFEREGKIYSRFGLKYFLYFLRIIGSERLRKNTSPLRKEIHSLKRFEHQTRISELSHLLAGVSVGIITVYVAILHGIGSTVWLVVSNIVFNVYPIMMQRYNRPRVQGLLRKFVPTHV